MCWVMGAPSDSQPPSYDGALLVAYPGIRAVALFVLTVPLLRCLSDTVVRGTHGPEPPGQRVLSTPRTTRIVGHETTFE